MCLAAPGRVIEVNGALARIEIAGRADWYNALATPEIATGDWALTHAHMVVQIVPETEALDMLAALASVNALLDEFDSQAGGEFDATRAGAIAMDTRGYEGKQGKAGGA